MLILSRFIHYCINEIPSTVVKMQLCNLVQVATMTLLASQPLLTIAAPIEAKQDVNSINEKIGKRQEDINAEIDEIREICLKNFSNLGPDAPEICKFFFISI